MVTPDIDLSKTGSTTHLTCGTTNCGHYVIVQQGISTNVEHEESKKIFDELSKYAPTPPNGDSWLLYEINLSDYKSWHIKEHYKIDIEYKFMREREKWSNQVQIPPASAKVIYDMFRKAVYRK